MQLGLLVEPEKPEEIGNAILDLVNNEDRLKEMSINSKTFADKNLNWDRIIVSIENEIKERRC